jgi:hypothetical protein
MVWSAKKFKIYLPNHSVQIIYTLAGMHNLKFIFLL